MSNFNFDNILNKYGNDPQRVLDKYDYESGESIFQRINDSGNDVEDLKDIINNIVLWKLNRLVYVDDNILFLLKKSQEIKTPEEAYTGKRKEVENLLIPLLKSKGVRLAMASTFLHFFNPGVFPIIDQRAYRVVFLEDYKASLNPETNAKVYLKYLEKCVEYYQANLSKSSVQFSDIDKYLYQLDILAGNRVKM